MCHLTLSLHCVVMLCHLTKCYDVLFDNVITMCRYYLSSSSVVSQRCYYASLLFVVMICCLTVSLLHVIMICCFTTSLLCVVTTCRLVGLSDNIVMCGWRSSGGHPFVGPFRSLEATASAPGASFPAYPFR